MPASAQPASLNRETQSQLTINTEEECAQEGRGTQDSGFSQTAWAHRRGQENIKIPKVLTLTNCYIYSRGSQTLGHEPPLV